MIKPSRQLKVMAVGDEDDYQEGIPEVDEDTLIRSKLKTEQLEIGLRQQALARILHQVGGHPVEKGVDIQDCLTKFDPERIRQRRAFSLSDIDSEESWQAAGTDSAEDDTKSNRGDEDADQVGTRERRYSFPLTPRRKKELPNTLVFERAIEDIREANQDFLIDNVYTETRHQVDPLEKKKKKTVSRRTQTYLRELLQVEGEEVHESDLEVLMEEDAEIEFDFAKGLIDKMIDHI